MLCPASPVTEIEIYSGCQSGRNADRCEQHNGFLLVIISTSAEVLLLLSEVLNSSPTSLVNVCHMHTHTYKQIKAC